jgi:hypothetical protein
MPCALLRASTFLKSVPYENIRSTPSTQPLRIAHQAGHAIDTMRDCSEMVTVSK